MLLVLTQDPQVRRWAEDPRSGSQRWGGIGHAPAGPQQGADAWWRQALPRLGAQEPLLLAAHGNDTEIGDPDPDGWGWTVGAVVGALGAAPAAWRGPVVIWACAEQVTNFSARLAVALGDAQVFDGLWVYGFNRPVPVDKTFPDPALLGQQVDLQPTQVTF